MAYPLVWSEREAGDWEACVAASGLTAFVYGGWTKFPLGIYTQAEREAIEEYPDQPLGYPDEPGYTVLDRQMLKRYGKALRKCSVATIAAALARPGVGLLLAGKGFPDTQWQSGFTGAHSVFFLPVTTTTGLLFDPMAPNKSAGKLIASSKIAAWASGVGPNNCREVRENEFVDVVNVREVMFLGADGKPAPRTVTFSAGKTYVGWALDGTFERYVPPTNSSAPARSRCTIIRTDVMSPRGAGFIYITAGVFADHPYLVESQDGLIVAPDPVPPPPDCSAAVAAAVAPKDAEIARIRAVVAEHVAVQTAPEDDLLETVGG